MPKGCEGKQGRGWGEGWRLRFIFGWRGGRCQIEFLKYETTYGRRDAFGMNRWMYGVKSILCISLLVHTGRKKIECLCSGR